MNYIDTALAYGGNDEVEFDEEIVGQAIAGRPRDSYVLASKTPSPDASGARKDLEASLSHLGVAYLDVYHLHCIGGGESTGTLEDGAADLAQRLGPGGALEELERAKAEGLIRNIGVTGHSWPNVGKALATGRFDTVLCWHNCALHEAESFIFPEARKHGVGVVIMNASARGGASARVADLATAAGAPPEEQFYRYVLTHPEVNVGIMGLRDVGRFARVAAALSHWDTLSPTEMEAMEAHGAKMRAATEQPAASKL